MSIETLRDLLKFVMTSKIPSEVVLSMGDILKTIGNWAFNAGSFSLTYR